MKTYVSLKKYAGWFAVFLLTASNALAAANYDIKTMTPEIQNALNGRQARYGLLQRLKAAGAVGENNRGYVELMQQGGEANLAVPQENSDRLVIYQAIVSQNGLGPAGMRQVESVFAEVQREKAAPGDPIQLPSGQWVRK